MRGYLVVWKSWKSGKFLGRKDPVLDLVIIGCEDEISEVTWLGTRSKKDVIGIGEGIAELEIGVAVGIWSEWEGCGVAAASETIGAEFKGCEEQVVPAVELGRVGAAVVIATRRLIKKGESPAALSLDGSW